ncbi:hypothetical protein VPNG_04641 [Cytospora leucostoma]|uniref:Uncharacterized protein n=1 Tax=Cytospora leucostoma TaxID=1230097 RepID=A0A423XCC2_9PEZI|nr:hypothetical protein VPNG_04641 [Cytospora leucostoma]
MVKQIEKPVTATWDMSISNADFAKLKRGVKAESMDNHWRFLVMTDEDLANEALELGGFSSAGLY